MFEYFALLNQLLLHGKEIEVRGKKTKEILGAELCITNEHNFYEVPGIRSVEKYLKGELAWYFSGELTIEFILGYSKFWKQVASMGIINSNYGFLVFYKRSPYGCTQYDWVKKSLKKDKYSRQAVILYNDKEYYHEENKDFICTQTQQFFIRDNTLSCIVYIRSSDAIRGLSFDIPWWSVVQQQLLFDLQETYPKLELGQMKIMIGSSHIYEEHYGLVNDMLSFPKKQLFCKLLKPLELSFASDDYKRKMDDFIEIR